MMPAAVALHWPGHRDVNLTLIKSSKFRQRNALVNCGLLRVEMDFAHFVSLLLLIP